MSNIIIKQVSDDDRLAVRQLEEYCFMGIMDYDREGVDLFMKHAFKPEICWGAFEANRLLAMLVVFPFVMKYRGELVKMGGMSSVATMPENRGMGLVQNLIKKSLEEMQKMGQLFSVLSPFKYSFYQRYGWGMTFSSRKITLDVNDFKKFGDGSCRFRGLEEGDYSAMNDVYNVFNTNYNGPQERDDWRFRARWKIKNGHHWYGAFNVEGELTAYIMYERKGRELNIFEICFIDLQSRHELFRFIYQHEAQVGKVIWHNIPDDDLLLLELDNPRQKIEVVPGMMTRITDVSAFFKQYVSLAQGKISFCIHDSMAPWNNRNFYLQVVDNALTVKEGELSSDVDVECDISVFSQLVMGSFEMDDFLNIEQIILNNKSKLSLLKDMFPKQLTYLNEIF